MSPLSTSDPRADSRSQRAASNSRQKVSYSAGGGASSRESSGQVRHTGEWFLMSSCAVAASLLDSPAGKIGSFWVKCRLFQTRVMERAEIRGRAGPARVNWTGTEMPSLFQDVQAFRVTRRHYRSTFILRDERLTSGCRTLLSRPAATVLVLLGRLAKVEELRGRVGLLEAAGSARQASNSSETDIQTDEDCGSPSSHSTDSNSQPSQTRPVIICPLRLITCFLLATE